VKLVLMRHAEAGDADPRRYPDDRLRPLTPGGVREHRAVVQALARMGLSPSAILTSPLVRARETAEITAQGLAWTGIIRPTDVLGDQFSADGLLAELRGEAASAAVLCVGHEPSLSAFAARMLHAESRLELVLPKSGVVGLDCAGRPTPGHARLLFLLPRELHRVLGSPVVD
jgi:phosphohistidine phosphatase